MFDNLDLSGIAGMIAPIRVYISYILDIFKKLIQMISDYAGIDSPFDEETTA